MLKEEVYYKSKDNKTDIHAVIWSPDNKDDIKGIIQIAHGMTEYILRYEDFAKVFTKGGFVVCGNDHLGHGTSLVDENHRMYFGPKGSWHYAIDDMETLRLKMKEFYNKDLPYILLGFSLGSFLVRHYLMKYPDNVNGAIIVGTGKLSLMEAGMANIVANMECLKKGEENSTQTIKKMTIGTYNKMFKPNRTDFDWLMTDVDSLDEYIFDKNRGGALTSGLFREMIYGMRYVSKIKNISQMNKDVPVLFLSGDKDPVGKKSKGVIDTYNDYIKAGVKDVDIRLYQNLRHDILHDGVFKFDVFEKIYDWLYKRFVKGE